MRMSDWIPCDERLPEESDGTVLVCFPDIFPYNSKEPFPNAKHDQRVTIATRSQFSKMWYKESGSIINFMQPIAWMPLPEPYEVKKDGDM